MRFILPVIILFFNTSVFSQDTDYDEIGLYFDSFLEEIRIDYRDNGTPPFSKALSLTPSNNISIEMIQIPEESGENYDFMEDKYLNLKISSYSVIEQDKVQLMFDNPVKIPGVCKTISVLCTIYSENNNSFIFSDVNIYFVISDCLGIDYYIPLGYLSGELFYEYTTSIPEFIRQRSFDITENMGITLKGFIFYIYPKGENIIDIGITEIKAVTDNYYLEFYSPDEIPKGW